MLHKTEGLLCFNEEVCCEAVQPEAAYEASDTCVLMKSNIPFTSERECYFFLKKISSEE